MPKPTADGHVGVSLTASRPSIRRSCCQRHHASIVGMWGFGYDAKTPQRHLGMIQPAASAMQSEYCWCEAVARGAGIKQLAVTELLGPPAAPARLWEPGRL